MDYKKVKTSAEVWAVIMAKHSKELKVFSSYSAPEGDMFGDSSQGRMETGYGFEDADFPLMEAKTTWDITASGSHKRENEQHEYWLCIPVKCEDCE